MTKARDIASAAPAPAGVTSTELGYVDGVTSAIQTQVDGKAATSHNHDTTYINQSTFDAKGDLIVGTGNDAYARLAVSSSNGDTIVADSSTSTGLRYQGNFAAGKNKIINGDFGIWQRGTSFTQSPSVEIFTADRFAYNANGSGGTLTISQQSFTPGTAPVAGYEGQYFLRYNCVAARTSQSFNVLVTRMEDVRTFAGQTITVSYWAKASTSVSLVDPYVTQYFGSGGSSSVNTLISSVNLTTSWQRFTSTITLPSISGKTIGTSSSLQLTWQGLPNTTGVTIDFWGVQVEAGLVATAFQTATGTIQGELAACQRYYWRSNANGAYSRLSAFGGTWATTASNNSFSLPVEMRVYPTAVEYSTLRVLDVTGAAAYAVSAVTISNNASRTFAGADFTITGATANRVTAVETNNSSAGYIAFSAEL